ncbi:MAG: protein translocase subunit SecDF, partial [Bacteroidales bacterium]|nr:protein translocase subunit SecDF [Bacteroidales bacterium]
MQSKGWIRFVAILLAIASIWQLSFTAVTRIQESKAAKYAAEQAQQYVESNNVPADVREYVQDSVANFRNRAYIDSISAEKVFFGYTFKSVKEKEINLGLDLKGGMNVMLQVQLEDLVKALSGNSTDPDFVAALAQAKANNVNSSQDFIGLFAEAWQQVAPQRRLAEVFA